MDPISYGVAAKQKQRIEKVIAEPDSTSGVITVPKVIAAGETITVPAGRTAVLPNVQVDGELVVDGEVFIPSGSSYTATNINVSGVGSRITGDFSNAIVSNRVAFQTSTTNGNTIVTAKPNGAGTSGVIRVENNSDSTNASYGSLQCSPSAVIVGSGINGVGTYLPMAFLTSGAERMRIGTAGNVGIGTSSPIGKLQVKGANPQLFIEDTSGGTNGKFTAIGTNNGVMTFSRYLDNGTLDSEKMHIDASGNVLLTSGTGALGYGTGAGGQVTQLTSKSTSVTLNKPCGRIIMNNEALAAGASVIFGVNNSLVTNGDLLYCFIDDSRVGNTCSVLPWYVNNGIFYLQVKNNGLTSYSDTFSIKFVIIKGATA